MEKTILKEAMSIVNEFDIDKSNYKEIMSDNIITRDASNKVYAKNHSPANKIRVNFLPNVKNAIVFFGYDLEATGDIIIHQSNGIVYIGNHVNLSKVEIRTQALGSCVIVGNNVTASGYNRWYTGSYPGSKFSSIIIGDDCMFSYEITVRSSDNHPVMSLDFKTQLNSPFDYVVVEPYVWVCQGAKILKSTRIGALSIIGASAIVTKSVPRHSKVFGAPARFDKLEGVWLRNRSPASTATAQKYLQKYLGK